MDRRDTPKHQHKRDSPQQIEFNAVRNNVKWEPLNLILFLMKESVSVLDKEFAAFKYLLNFSP